MGEKFLDNKRFSFPARHCRTGAVALIFTIWLTLPILVSAQTIATSEYAQRRTQMLERIQDGLLLLHARPTPKEMEQPGWIQDPTFFYFTGFKNLPGAILVLDGPLREARLFVPPPPLSFGFPVKDLVPETGEASAHARQLSSIEPWKNFIPYLKNRVENGITRFYVDGSRRPQATGVPEPMWPVTGEKNLWRRSLANEFPNVEIVSAFAAISELRWVKSAAEIAILRKNAGATTAALLAGIQQIRPGVMQREVEAVVVASCFEAGAAGPSFWPWLMSGPNTHIDRLGRSFYDYEHLNRSMQAGELVRVDVGCGGGSYGGDVGRTVPVSGKFTKEQGEIWDLFVAGYRAGLQAIKPGATRSELFAAGRSEIAQSSDHMQTVAGKKAAAQMLNKETGINWHLHGVGIKSGEAALDTLKEGSVLAFEPMFSFGPDAFYLEDMIVVTTGGHEVLSAGLPYTAKEIEAAMAKGTYPFMNIMFTTALGAFLGALLSLLVIIIIEHQRKPKLSLKIEEPPTDISYSNRPANKARFLRVRLSNRGMPRLLKWLGRNAAMHSHGEIQVYHQNDGAVVFSSPMPIRWAGSDEPFSFQALPGGKVAQVFDPSKFNAAFYRDCHAGSEEPIDVVARFDNDADCYGWTNENYLGNKVWRNPDWKLPRGRYLVTITVHTAGEKVVDLFKLENSVGVQHFRLMNSTKEDRQKIGIK